MGNLSEHFSNKDFLCRCGECKDAVRIHLGLIGALEAITEYFRKTPTIHEAYRCDIYNEKHNIQKKNSHRLGKAAHISLQNVELKDLFNFAQTLQEIRGIGFNPSENLLHIDTRTLDKDENKEVWLKDGSKITPMTEEMRSRYGLNQVNA